MRPTPEASVPQHSDEGKLVVLLETANESVIMERISSFEHLSGVINVAMVYHQIDTDPHEAPQTDVEAEMESPA
ncbi:chaperone NapD [Halioglobus sp. HI00S01]|uniref:chaperone NapD n=1 Tax=Halioglobus sp. HI00S01 TaxID=1822214 RepID=UPI0009EED6B0|nr:chaperone NapD [Halioglobus sp. HI00S01]